MTAIQSETTELCGRPVTPAPASPESRGSAANYVTGIADGNLATPVKLRDFLFGLGVVYRLPKKARKTADPATGEKKRRFVIRIPIRQVALALAPLAVAAAGYVVYLQFASIPMPAEVVGTWSTADGRYKGRTFWLNPEAVAFQNGASSSQFSVHQVERIKRVESADTVFLSIDYESDGKPVTLQIAYRATPQPEIRLRNQPKIRWTRTGNAPVIR